MRIPDKNFQRGRFLVFRWGATVDRKQFLAGQLKLSPGAQGRPVLQHSAQTPLLFLTAMVGLVLLIACANLACLLFARGESRQHEIAARLALRASRGRVIRQLLTESGLLAVAGGATGLFLGWAALTGLITMMPPNPSTSGLNASLDLRFLAVTAAAAILSGVLCGMFPAVRASRESSHSAFKDQGANATGRVGSVRLRKSLIVAQVGRARRLSACTRGFERGKSQCSQATIEQAPIDVNVVGYQLPKTGTKVNQIATGVEGFKQPDAAPNREA